MNKRKSGFTLMEIMVVIIVIAVLASVAGPMIGSITDQGRASATKSKLSSLKSALLAYQADVGRFPFTGSSGQSKTATCYCQSTLLGTTDDTNVLVCNSFSLVGGSSSVKNYGKKWKGPYMDSEASDFMVDSWGKNIQYIASGKNIYLWSFGPNMTNDCAPSALGSHFKSQSDSDGDFDDIIVSVTRMKGSFDGCGTITDD